MITSNIKCFIEANKDSPVVEAEHLTPEFGSINTVEDMERPDRTKYTLQNSHTYVLTKYERESMNYTPIWAE